MVDKMKKAIALIMAATLLSGCAAENTQSSQTSNSSQSVSQQSEVPAETEEAFDEEQALEVIKEIIPIADRFYAIFNRCELPVDDKTVYEDANGFRYSPVKGSYQTLEELKEDVEHYFTKEWLDGNFYLNLDEDFAFYKDIDGVLCKNIDAESKGENVWSPENSEITAVSDEEFTAVVPYVDVYETPRTAEVKAVNEDGEWKIDEWVLER